MTWTLRALTPAIYSDVMHVVLTCVKSQYLAVNGLPYSAFPADSMSRRFHSCIFVPLIPFSQFNVSQFQRPYQCYLLRQMREQDFYCLNALLRLSSLVRFWLMWVDWTKCITQSKTIWIHWFCANVFWIHKKTDKQLFSSVVWLCVLIIV